MDLGIPVQPRAILACHHTVSAATRFELDKEFFRDRRQIPSLGELSARSILYFIERELPIIETIPHIEPLIHTPSPLASILPSLQIQGSRDLSMLWQDCQILGQLILSKFFHELSFKQRLSKQIQRQIRHVRSCLNLRFVYHAVYYVRRVEAAEEEFRHDAGHGSFSYRSRESCELYRDYSISFRRMFPDDAFADFRPLPRLRLKDTPYDIHISLDGSMLANGRCISKKTPFLGPIFALGDDKSPSQFQCLKEWQSFPHWYLPSEEDRPFEEGSFSRTQSIDGWIALDDPQADNYSQPITIEIGTNVAHPDPDQFDDFEDYVEDDIAISNDIM